VKVRTIALGVAVVVSAVAALPGCGGDRQAATVTAAETRTATATATPTSTATETVQGEVETGSKQKRRRGDGLRFRGNGDGSLPPIRVREGGASLRWRNGGEVFSLFSEDGTLVDSVDRRGQTSLRPGRHAIDVIATGAWLVTISNARRAR
jgi:hypothetical protein